MNNEPSSRDWFDEDLSDEAAFAIHLFLERFTYNFEGVYYGQIRRYLKDNSSVNHLPTDQSTNNNNDDQFDEEQESNNPF